MTPEEYDAYLSETDKLIDRLHSLYEQWFQGIERREPMKQRDMVHKRIDLLRNNLPRNTAHRFRAQNIIQRWVTLSHHWSKCARQIEEGTFRRDVLRAKRRAAEMDARERAKTAARPADKGSRAAPSEGIDGWALDVDADLDDAFDRAFDEPSAAVAPAAAAAPRPQDEGAAQVIAPRFGPGQPVAAVAPPRAVPPPSSVAARPGAPPPPPVARPQAPPPRRASNPPVPRPAPPAAAKPAPPAVPRPAAPAPAAASEPQLRALFDRYVEARKQNNERVDNVKFETVAASIEKMRPELEKKHQGKRIDFEVVVKDGRVGFRPVAK